LPYFICPSRRRVKLYPYSEFSAYPMRNTMFLEKTAKTDYAASAGDYFFHGVEGPRSLSEGDSPSYDDWHDLSKSTGVIYQRSEVEPRQVIDGMTKTYLIGEKYLRVDRYRTGFDTGDDQTMYCGFDPDINRWTTNDHGIVNPPKADNSDAGLDPYRFGSPHPDGCSFVFCDGSVRIIQYTIDDETHRAFGNREDGQYIE
jgi:prepilin-type processing-associated H-X9-DG protein